MALVDTIRLFSAGSLRGALTDVAKAFQAASGNTVEAKYGPSGLLKNGIAGGAPASSSRIAPMRWWRRRKIPASRSSRCPII